MKSQQIVIAFADRSLYKNSIIIMKNIEINESTYIGLEELAREACYIDIGDKGERTVSVSRLLDDIGAGKFVLFAKEIYEDTKNYVVVPLDEYKALKELEDQSDMKEN